MHTRSARAGTVRFTAPVALIGALATALTAAPAEAAGPAHPGTAPMPVHSMLPTGAQWHAAVPVRQATKAPAAYTVKPGDTVSAIAIRHGLRPADVLGWNGLGWRSVIYPGQKLRVGAAPATASAPKASTPLASAATAAASTAASTAAVPTSHKVVPGDTLFGIAKKYGTSVAVLLQANGLGNGSIIYPGQSLRIAPPAPAQRSAKLDPTQRAHAVHIIRVGRELGVPDRGIEIALATAMVESSMRNLDHGDRDSLGLFQQRPSRGWGTEAQILDADRSIRVFYGGKGDPNGAASRGLLDISGWQGKPFTLAAQAVQISAYPDRYGRWETQAHSWLASLR